MIRWVPDLADALIVLGCASVVAGVWLIHRPAALVVAGLLLFLLALIGGSHGRSS